MNKDILSNLRYIMN